MKLIDVYHMPTLGKSNYYLASLRDGEGEAWPAPGTLEVSGYSQGTVVLVSSPYRVGARK